MEQKMGLKTVCPTCVWTQPPQNPGLGAPVAAGVWRRREESCQPLVSWRREQRHDGAVRAVTAARASFCCCG